jgi:hypothetical protein
MLDPHHRRGSLPTITSCGAGPADEPEPRVAPQERRAIADHVQGLPSKRRWPRQPSVPFDILGLAQFLVALGDWAGAHGSDEAGQSLMCMRSVVMRLMICRPVPPSASTTRRGGCRSHSGARSRVAPDAGRARATRHGPLHAPGSRRELPGATSKSPTIARISTTRSGRPTTRPRWDRWFGPIFPTAASTSTGSLNSTSIRALRVKVALCSDWSTRLHGSL